MLTLLRQSADYSLNTRTYYHSMPRLVKRQTKKAVESPAEVLTKACPLCYCKVNESVCVRADPYAAAGADGS